IVIACGAIDLQAGIIPDRLTIALLALGCGATAFVAPSLVTRLLTSVGTAGALWLVAAAYRRVRAREGLGLGDIKLLGAVGTSVGSAGILFVLIGASLAGLVVATFLVFHRRRDATSRLPFAPFISAAAVAWLLAKPAGAG